MNKMLDSTVNLGTAEFNDNDDVVGFLSKEPEPQSFRFVSENSIAVSDSQHELNLPEIRFNIVLGSNHIAYER